MLQKSQFNLAYSEKTILVNYYIYLQDDQSYWISFNRLENKMKHEFIGNWSFFDETDLIKMLTFLGKLLNKISTVVCSIVESIKIKRTGKKEQIPFVPYIFIGFVVSTFLGELMSTGYLNLIGVR